MICRICKGHFHKSTISPLLQGVNSIYQLLLFIFHLFCLNLFLLLCFIVGSKDFQTEISNKWTKIEIIQFFESTPWYTIQNWIWIWMTDFWNLKVLEVWNFVLLLYDSKTVWLKENRSNRLKSMYCSKSWSKKKWPLKKQFLCKNEIIFFFIVDYFMNTYFVLGLSTN